MRGGAVLGRVVDVARACHAVAKQVGCASVVNRKISQEAQHDAVLRQVDSVRLPPIRGGEGSSVQELHALIRRAGETVENEEWMYELQKKEDAEDDLYSVAWGHLRDGRIADGAGALRQYEAAARGAPDAPLAGRLAQRVEEYRDAGGQEEQPMVHSIAWYSVRPYVKSASLQNDTLENCMSYESLPPAAPLV